MAGKVVHRILAIGLGFAGIKARQKALLDAAWAELTERGYDDMTVDAVATRAGTSRAVLYRRWPNKQDLVLAALTRHVKADFVVAPDTGSLRGDVIALLKLANKVRLRLAILVFTRLGGLYREANTNLAELGRVARVPVDRFPIA